MDRLYNEKEAAEYLGISTQRLEELVREKKLPAFKLGGEFLRFFQKDLDNVKDPGSLPSAHKKYSLFSRIKDYIYYNDFYIVVAILIIILAALIFKISF
jgi:excisionase family DNA binding protein